MKKTPRAPRPISETNKQAFLNALSGGGTVKAASVAGAHPRSKWYALRDKDEEFAKAWDAALDEGTDVLEDEAKRRAVDGVDEPVYQGKELVGHVRKYSDTLLIFLLKGRRPERYRENARVEMTGKDGGPLEVHQVEGAEQALVAKLAPVVDIAAARAAQAGDRHR